MKLQHSEPKYTILFRQRMDRQTDSFCNQPNCPNKAVYRWGIYGYKCRHHDLDKLLNTENNVMVINHL